MSPKRPAYSAQQLADAAKEIADLWPPHVLQAATAGWSTAAARFSRSYRVAVCSPRTIMAIHQTPQCHMRPSGLDCTFQSEKP